MHRQRHSRTQEPSSAERTAQGMLDTPATGCLLLKVTDGTAEFRMTNAKPQTVESGHNQQAAM